ncbi:hypothetical protein [Burkholderia pseudomallei]|uniref:hypothetical protein n=1 Tax=Burkholderia pseudomallei TaxID=28450 RepID=UPI0008FF0E08|nr:hypothetical protein [Burkholderia pseudomallei]APD36566.1 hypothetical protein BK015_16440 [Burkholderia pseudomallei]ARK39939.1 hypothetical protein BOC60_06715 [Burkholderia pseudomallei]ARL36074.1 hypothetical protein BOC49_07225 [Burkholderia pseudomallei]ARL58636.1 hypothetical protein BOC52_18735 [Burkholderia pseudomallei]ARL68603.1 hypothetical protein BOC53_36640 [Burkholderia pseudomallei]
MAKTNKKALRPLASHFVAEVNRPDRQHVGTRIGDAMELLDSLQWAAHKAMSEDDYWLVLSLFRASLPSIGAALEAANDALGEARLGRYVYSNDVTAGGAALSVPRAAG